MLNFTTNLWNIIFNNLTDRNIEVPIKIFIHIANVCEIFQ